MEIENRALEIFVNMIVLIATSLATFHIFTSRQFKNIDGLGIFWLGMFYCYLIGKHFIDKF